MQCFFCPLNPIMIKVSQVYVLSIFRKECKASVTENIFLFRNHSSLQNLLSLTNNVQSQTERVTDWSLVFHKVLNFIVLIFFFASPSTCSSIANQKTRSWSRGRFTAPRLNAKLKIIQQRAKEDMKVGLVANSFCTPKTADIVFRKAVYLAVCVNLSAKNCGSQQRGKLHLKRLT